MLEVFAYTERVVNMIRPRKLLMMAIDGVAPRAKMNQQRSRRFRSALEAREKEEEKQAALEEWRAMGLPVSEEAAQSKKAWDSNAITPGTPFMDLLASSLRYWVIKKMNEDPGWKDLQVVVSDASVPGEGEHKIMDHIRRQRSHPEHDPNTKHVIYGLDADLIMLSLATHEPRFKVLREDVFAQGGKPKTCNKCGHEGHIAINCMAKPKLTPLDPASDPKARDQALGKKPDRKPFVFLDVGTLREYLEIELNIPGLTIPFDLERAIDDWVFLIFFVGNDFLPHLPSLEIREGAIDMLLKIWKQNLPRVGSWLTKHGQVELKNVQVIMEGVAAQEDEIFRKRQQDEERQEEKNKRRKVEDENRQRAQMRARGETPPLSAKTDPTTDSQSRILEQSSTMTASQNGQKNGSTIDHRKQAIAALSSGNDAEIFKAQASIRLANLSAAEMLKAELAGQAKKEARKSGKTGKKAGKETKKMTTGHEYVGLDNRADCAEQAIGSDVPQTKAVADELPAQELQETEEELGQSSAVKPQEGAATRGFQSEEEADASVERPLKRSFGEIDEEEEADANGIEEEDVGNETVDPVSVTNISRKVNPDGTVTYEDTVRLFEPGYRERYYRQKFGVELSDSAFRRKLVQSYVEGLSWVLAYYYQGCPSWTWYYPFHFSPFAADFTNLETMEVDFELGKPFRPYDQLMGVLPADSKTHLPRQFHPLMTEEDSTIIDFYPQSFEIDMNGKKMAWQGVVLLPFIDEARLLLALEQPYSQLSDEEHRRNAFGDNALLASEDNRVYEDLASVYTMRKKRKQAAGDGQEVSSQGDRRPLNAALSGGITGFIRPDPSCIPGATFSSPLTKVGLPDIVSNRAISVLYEFPEQKTPHRSTLLKGARPPARRLTDDDREWTRKGGQERRGGGGRGRGSGRGGCASGRGGGPPTMRTGAGSVATTAAHHLHFGMDGSAWPTSIPTGPAVLSRQGSHWGGRNHGVAHGHSQRSFQHGNQASSGYGVYATAAPGFYGNYESNDGSYGSGGEGYATGYGGYGGYSNYGGSGSYGNGSQGHAAHNSYGPPSCQSNGSTYGAYMSNSGGSPAHCGGNYSSYGAAPSVAQAYGGGAVGYGGYGGGGSFAYGLYRQAGANDSYGGHATSQGSYGGHATSYGSYGQNQRGGRGFQGYGGNGHPRRGYGGGWRDR